MKTSDEMMAIYDKEDIGINRGLVMGVLLAHAGGQYIFDFLCLSCRRTYLIWALLIWVLQDNE